MSNRNDNGVSRTLELDTILERVSELAASELGQERIQNLSFIADCNDLRKSLGQVTEMRDLLKYDDAFPLQGFPDLRPQMKRVEVAGAFLLPKNFLGLKRLLWIVRQVRVYVSDRQEKYPLLKKMIEKIVLLRELEQEIGRIIDPSGEVKDKASEELFRVRREIERISSRARKRLESILKSMVSQGYAQEDNLALREGRLVLPIKEACRARLKGVVIDQSSSGATIFVEPLEVLEMNNTIRSLKVQERQEVERILIALTDRVRENSFEIETNFEIAGDLDSLVARAKFALRIGGNPARIDEDGVLELKEARHPLLLLRESQEEVVPLSLRMGERLKTLVITGPNAGGKTVALKTIGLLALMHQHGLHVPVAEGTSLPIFFQIFADIGDQQSIEQDLSTFSSHVGHIKTILERADRASLVLLDEIGSATDPAEGAALATTILRNLTRRGCMTIATTHMGMLKVFAHEENGVENGSMAFDQKTFRPIYRFQMGIPGSSYAFEIAARLGISKDVVAEARTFVGEERGRLDRLILHLEQEVQRTHTLLEDAEVKESKLSALLKLYQEQIDIIHKKGEKRKQEILEEAEKVLTEANALVEKVVKEIRESQAEKESIRKAKKMIETQKKKVKVLAQKKEEVEEHSFRQGDWVVWKDHGGKGEVVSETDRTGRVLVQWNDVKIRVPVEELVPGEIPERDPISTGWTSYRFDKEIVDEIDLRGMTADEAVETVDKYLNDAAVTGFTNVRIIHGKGTGVLRREISRYLKGHPLVKSQRLGNWNEGDTGVTIVELK